MSETHIFGNKKKLSDESVKDIISTTLEIAAIRSIKRIPDAARKQLAVLERRLIKMTEREGVTVEEYRKHMMEIIATTAQQRAPDASPN